MEQEKNQSIKTSIPGFVLKPAVEADVPLILDFIKALAVYEKLAHEVVATEDLLRKYIFGEEKVAEVVIGYEGDTPVGFALFIYNYSTFLGKPGIYLEDLFVIEEYRGKGYGKSLLLYLTKLAKEKDCGRVEWAVLDWNEPAIDFYTSLGAVQMDEWIINRVTGKTLEDLASSF